MVRFEYEKRDMLLHRMHPLAKLFALFYLLTLIVVYWNLYYLIPVVIVTLLLARNTQVPTVWLKALSVTWIGWGIGQLMSPRSLWMVDTAFFKVLPPEFTQKMIFVITPQGFPLFGYTALTYGSLYHLTVTFMRFPVWLVAGSTLVYSLNLSDVITLMNQSHVPSVIVLITQAAWRYLSLIVDMMTRVWNAQTLRGLRIETRNPIKLLRAAIPFLIPVARQFVGMVDQVGISVANRAFGSEKVFHPYRILKKTMVDKICIYVLPILLVIQFYLLMTPPWYYGNI